MRGLGLCAFCGTPLDEHGARQCDCHRRLDTIVLAVGTAARISRELPDRQDTPARLFGRALRVAARSP
jgi:hypothetical protein